MYSVFSVIVDSLPGNTKKQGIDKFVSFGVRLVHSFFLSLGQKTQTNHWTKRMVRTRLITVLE